MVGALMLMKILHCKRTRQNYASRTNKKSEGLRETSHEENRDRGINNETQKTCRVCLKEGHIPIYGRETGEDVSEPLNTFAGIEVQVDDIYPKFLCEICHSLLQGAILLRKTAQNSDQILRQPTEEIIASDNEDFTQNIDDNVSLGCDYVVVNKSKVLYDCKRCNINFDSYLEYTKHRLSQEHECMRQKCPICHNTYSTQYFKKHLDLHKMESPYMCDVCGKKFAIQGQFTRHHMTHSYNLPFKCSLCPYRGRFSESLKMHMRSHTGEKPYQCSQCPSRFVSKSNLNKHALTHKGAHDFKCESCGRGFYTKRDMELHYRVIHAGIKDHQCNICGKAFGSRKQMMKHQLKVHKREKLRSGRTPLYLQIESKKQQEEQINT